MSASERPIAPTTELGTWGQLERWYSYAKALEQERDTLKRELGDLREVLQANANEAATFRGLLKSVDGYFVDRDENSPLHQEIKKQLYGESDKALTPQEAQDGE